MNQPFLHALHTLLDKEQIQSVLLFSRHKFDAGIDSAQISVLHHDLGQLNQPDQAADFAVLIDYLEHLPKKDGLALIARLRDVLTRRVMVNINLANTAEWQQTDFLGLGFQCVARYEDGDNRHEIYVFDLRHYKPAPDWLNAKFWANPHLWDKYRW
ncbi:MAG TPA: DUF6231 family protein [Pseudomonadales bacterium]|nr:DUF6231 family protein [Pseudomonadales bacterium]